MRTTGVVSTERVQLEENHPTERQRSRQRPLQPLACPAQDRQSTLASHFLTWIEGGLLFLGLGIPLLQLNHNAAFVASARGMGFNGVVFREREMDDAPLVGGHRF